MRKPDNPVTITTIDILKHNVYELEKELRKAHSRIQLIVESMKPNAKPDVLSRIGDTD